jgi:cardiolipin synthase
MNMDIRSLRLHKELMVWMFDQELTRQLEDIFERDLLHCREMTLTDVRSVGRWQRFRNSFARLVSAEI